MSTSLRDGELVSNILKRQKKHLFKLFLICCVSFLVRQKINYLNVIILGKCKQYQSCWLRNVRKKSKQLVSINVTNIVADKALRKPDSFSKEEKAKSASKPWRVYNTIQQRPHSHLVTPNKTTAARISHREPQTLSQNKLDLTWMHQLHVQKRLSYHFEVDIYRDLSYSFDILGFGGVLNLLRNCSQMRNKNV